jgi:hypothetical protein
MRLPFRVLSACALVVLLLGAGCQTTSPSPRAGADVQAPGPTDAPLVASIHSRIGRAAYQKLYAEDKMVRDFIRSKGEPEYVLILDRRRVKLVYWQANYIVSFGNTWFQSETGRIHHEPRIPDEVRDQILALQAVAAK